MGIVSKFKGTALAVTLALTCSASMVQASTISVQQGHPGFVVGFDDAGTSATFTWNLLGVSNNVFSFSIDIANTSAVVGEMKNRITSFAWGNSPKATSVTLVDGDGVFTGLATPNEVTGAGYQGFELNACVFSGPNNCVGGGGGGLLEPDLKVVE